MASQPPTDSDYPGWFDEFLADRAIRKPSPHTAKAYRQDFHAIATFIAGASDAIRHLPAAELTKDSLRAAFASYAETHSAASIRRCWSSWNTLCTYLYTAEWIEDNPMPVIGRPKVPKTLPKSFSANIVGELLAAVADGHGSTHPHNWPERDRALILTSLLAGLRADELLNANIGDIRRSGDGAVLHVRGKGMKDRRIPVSVELVEVLNVYLRTRTERFPPKRRLTEAEPLKAFAATAPLFIGTDGNRITRGTLQYRVLRAFKKAGLNGERPSGALIHGLRHTFATELANADVNVYMLMKLLGHESMATSQRYVDGAGADTRAAAESNPLYRLLHTQAPDRGPSDTLNFDTETAP